MEHGQVFPRLVVSTQTTETASQMFGVVDELAGNFADELANAKAAGLSKEKPSKAIAQEGAQKTNPKEDSPSSVEENSTTEHDPESPKEVSEETSIETQQQPSSEELSPDEISEIVQFTLESKEPSVIEETPSLASLQTPSSDETKSLPEPPSLEQEILPSAQPVEPTSDETSLIEESPSIETKPTLDQLIASKLSDPTPETPHPLQQTPASQDTSSLDPLVEQHPLTQSPDETLATVKPELTNNQNAPLETTEEPLPQEVDAAPVEAKGEKSNQLPKIPQNPISTAALQSRDAAPIAIQPTEVPVVEPPTEAIEKLPLTQPLSKEMQPERRLTPKERIEAAPEGFHDIIPEEEKSLQAQPLEAVDPILNEKIVATLKQTATATRIQPPVPSKVSPQLLDGLKSVNSEMARQVENMPGRPQTTPTQITAAPLRQPGFNTSFQPAASTKSAESTTYTDKFTELKEKVVEQVRVRMAAAPTKEGQKISIRLNPRFLGNIDISLTVEESSVQAHFLVENNTVRELLQRSHGDLQRTLEEQGIDVESVDIDLSNSESDLGGGGQAFNSIEEQEAARDWLASFHGLGLRGQEQEEERVSNAADPQESDDILNILA